LKHGILGYLGFPINFPNKKPFVTLCVLDKKENYFGSKHEELMMLLKDLIESNLALVCSNLDLKKINQEKDSLISILAHDLRSPLSGLLGLAELLSDQIEEFDKSEIQKMAQRIYNTALNTFSLMDELILWMHAQTEKLPREPKMINLSQLIDEALINLEPAAQAKTITFSKQTDNASFVYADEEMLKIIIRNLVSNAIKFLYPNGKIEIFAGKTSGITSITIADYGVGISSERIERLFTNRKPETSKRTAGEKGTGLGLLICIELIDKQNGAICVENELGKRQ
jgi:signal transduction histidine kinase